MNGPFRWFYHWAWTRQFFFLFSFLLNTPRAWSCILQILCIIEMEMALAKGQFLWSRGSQPKFIHNPKIFCPWQTPKVLLYGPKNWLKSVLKVLLKLVQNYVIFKTHKSIHKLKNPDLKKSNLGFWRQFFCKSQFGSSFQTQ